jgi:fibronectin type 3 domain-containing protein
MFERRPNLIAVRGFMAAVCVALLASCGAGSRISSVDTSVVSSAGNSLATVPVDVSASAGDAMVTLSWTASSGATSYNVKRASSSGGPYTQLASPTSTTYTDSSVTNATAYYYVVSALDEAGESANSAEVSATPEAASMPPAAPTNLQATAGNAQAGLTWSASSGASSYNVKRATTSGGPYTQLAATTSPSYTDATASNGTTYYYVVTAINSAGESADSAQVSVTPDPTITTPAIPLGLAATAGNAQVSLTWSASSGASSYHVKRATTSGGPYTQVGAPTSTSYTDSSLTNGTTYYYVVSALDSSGESTNSAQAFATPATPVTPPTTGLPSGPAFKFTPAPTLNGVTMVQNRDSVMIQVPAVANARDFRVLVQPTSVSANTNGTESVGGGTQFCAGIRQHQARTRYVADNVTMFPYYFYVNAGKDTPTDEVPQFFGPPPGAWSLHDLDTPPNLQIEITGVTSAMTVTVEAMDRLCPFPGTIGRTHADIALSHTVGDNNNPGNPWIDASSLVSFPIVTEAEVIAKYGSLIINGQGWAGGPNVQANPPLAPPFAQMAAVNPPMVLARAAVAIAPLANPPTPTATFFDDFSNANDTFTSLPVPKWTYPRDGAGVKILQNSKLTVYANGYTCCSPTASDDGYGYADAYIENGVMNTILSDWSQGVFSEISMFPRKAAHINTTTYLHVTYEVPSFATARRYWVVSLCGSSTPGQTLDSTGTLTQQIVHTTFFYNPTGANPSTVGWNCLQIFNREGNSYAFSNWESMHNLTGGRPPMPPNNGLYDLKDYIYNSIASISNPSQTAAYTVHPESDVMVMINKPIPAAGLPEVLGTNEQVVQGQYTSPVNVSPLQLDNPASEIAWFFKVDANGNPVSPILDDQQLVSPRTKYDLYIRNNRIIMYVNGEGRLCNDFTTPTTTLNIADAAVGFHQVLYHSSAEFTERFVDPDRGAAYYYRYNSPWVDRRTWDNIGFEENVSAPSDFNPNTCFEHKSLGPENNEP